jgi:hypothetical protein
MGETARAQIALQLERLGDDTASPRVSFGLCKTSVEH